MTSGGEKKFAENIVKIDEPDKFKGTLDQPVQESQTQKSKIQKASTEGFNESQQSQTAPSAMQEMEGQRQVSSGVEKVGAEEK